MHNYILKVNETDLDVFGHVNNATYLKFYEESRWDWLHSKNLGLKDLHLRGQGLVILNININYLKELSANQNITITMELSKYEGKVFTISQKMTGEDGAIHSDAIFTGGLFDLNQRKLIEPDDYWKSVFEL